MRTIKFRAWSKAKKGWKGLWIFRGGHTGEYDVSNEKIDILDLTNQWDDVELMQFTGLKDKNGKEIYEGDIIQTVCKDGIRLSKFEIFWDENSARWKKLREDSDTYDFAKSSITASEIIGNIYENPELVNKK